MGKRGTQQMGVHRGKHPPYATEADMDHPYKCTGNGRRTGKGSHPPKKRMNSKRKNRRRNPETDPDSQKGDA